MGGFWSDPIGTIGRSTPAIVGGAIGGAALGPMGFLPGALIGNKLGQNNGAPAPGDPYGGQPGYPTFNPIYNNSMAVGMTGQAQQGLEAGANRTGPSAWANLSNQAQYGEEARARDLAAQNAAGQTAQAQSALAAGGGLTSGARERTAEAGQRGAIGASQDAARQGTLNRMQVGINDEQNRLQNLGTAAGMENANNAMNMQAGIGENQALNAWNENLYNQKMAAWGAGKQADATMAAGNKPKGLLGLGFLGL